MKKPASLAMALLALLAFTGGAASANHQTSIMALMEQNNSGESGTATYILSEDNKTLTIEINLSNGTETAQPAHIHIGTCDTLDPKPFYPLNDVVNGKSVTVITEADLANLDYEVSNQFAINVHKSKAEASTYVSCGDIVPGGNVVGMPTTGNGGNDNIVPTLAFTALGLLATGTVLSFSRRRA